MNTAVAAVETFVRMQEACRYPDAGMLLGETNETDMPVSIELCRYSA